MHDCHEINYTATWPTGTATVNLKRTGLGDFILYCRLSVGITVP